MGLSGQDSWSDLVGLLKEELSANLSVEESVIRASVKAIPIEIREQVVQLFTAFALVPEDAFVPLAVMGMLYDVRWSGCGVAIGL
jgi:hypothetical protein